MSSSSAMKSSKLHQHGLKKGPWTTAEDMLLVEYVKKHGEGNWNAVQRHSGLMRCGKSCRLRWANHLRPNLKKGAFSAEEESIIVDLHAQMGNKWARMAALLPGRTDNEIKNYWNTRLKRRQRAGLSIYPQETLHHQVHHHHQHNSSPPSPSSLSLSPLLVVSSAHNPAPNPSPFHLFNTFSSPYNTSHQQLELEPSNNAMSLDNPSYPSAMAAPHFLNQACLESPLIYQYNSSLGFRISTSSNTGLLGLPSIQSPAASSSDFLMQANSSDGDYEVAGPGYGRLKNSGLLEDLLGESKALANSGAQKPIDEGPLVGADNENFHEKAAFGFGYGIRNDSSANNYEGKETIAPEEGNSPVDDDLLNLLDSFPLSVPIPDWDEGNDSESSILTNGTNTAVGSQLDSPRYNLGAASSRPANQDWNFGSCLWNNKPAFTENCNLIGTL